MLLKVSDIIFCVKIEKFRLPCFALLKDTLNPDRLEKTAPFAHSRKRVNMLVHVPHMCESVGALCESFLTVEALVGTHLEVHTDDVLFQASEALATLLAAPTHGFPWVCNRYSGEQLLCTSTPNFIDGLIEL